MEDMRQFNIRDGAGRLLCPACGFPGFAHEPAYDEHGGLAGITICPCCLWEPGFDDDRHASEQAKDSILASLRAYRAGWRDGPSWNRQIADRPPNWDARAQLLQLFEIAPTLR